MLNEVIPSNSALMERSEFGRMDVCTNDLPKPCKNCLHTQRIQFHN